MEQGSRGGKGILIAVVVAGLVVAAGLVGAVSHYSNRGRTDQLRTDDVGRERDVTNAAARGKAAGSATLPVVAATQPAGH